MSRLAYRPDVDGLRALSVLAVVAYHGSLACPGGFVGVDVFFVISGYLITALLLQDLSAGTFSFGGFWERRVRRILPAALVVTASTLVAGRLLMAPYELDGLFISALAQLVLLANVFFARFGGDGYFGEANDLAPLLHTWSLAIEEQFYLLFPLLTYVLHNRRRTTLGGVLALLWAASLAWSAAQTATRPTAAFFLLPSRSWELLTGALVAVWAERRERPLPAWAAELLSCIGLAAVVVPMFAYDTTTRFPGWAALPPCLGCAAIIAAGNGRFTFVGRLLSTRPMVGLGLISYSVYLWHWPIFSFARIVNGVRPDPAISGVLAVAGVAAGWLSWKFVETPFRNRRFAPTRRGLFVRAATAVGLLLATTVGLRGLERRREPVSPRLLHDVQYTGYEYVAAMTDGSAQLRTIGAQAKPQVDFLLWGDSHGMALAQALDEAAQRRGLKGRVALKPGTAPVAGLWCREQGADSAWTAAALDEVDRGGVKDVLLAARWSAYIDGVADLDLLERPQRRFEHLVRPIGVAAPTDPEQSRRVLGEYLDRLAERFSQQGVRLWILRPPPVQGQTNLAARWVRHRTHAWKWLCPFDPPAVTAADHRREQTSTDEVLNGVARRHPDVRLIDSAAAFFAGSGGEAQIVRNGLCLYRDNDHVSYSGSRFVVEQVLAGVLDEIQRRSADANLAATGRE